jgi:spermidine synthase
MMATRAVLALFTLSGLCGLVYQLIWTRWLGLLVGNFATATTTVVATFMGGLALGNALFGRVAARKDEAGALRLYAILEGILAVLAALSPLLLTTWSPLYAPIARACASPILRSLVCAVFLLPPTVMMGGTLPALVQALSASAPAALGPLYALNTVGGAVGPLLAGFFLMPALGFRATLWSIAGLNMAIAIAAFVLSGRMAARAEPRPGPREEQPSPEPAPDGPPMPDWLPYVLAGFSGLISLSFEIAMTRMFVLTVTGGSVYGFSIILSAFLVGLALGAWLVKRWGPKRPSGALMAFAAAQGLAWLFALSTPFWDLLPPILVRMWWIPMDFGTLMAADYAIVLVLLLILTTASGFNLPALAAGLKGRGAERVGRLFAANTLGSVIGPVLTGFVLLPGLGLHRTLLLLGALALVAAGGALAAARPRHLLAMLVPLPFMLVLTFVLPEPDISIMNSGMYNRPEAFRDRETDPATAAARMGRVIYQKDGWTGRISVRANSALEMSFIVNGKPDGSSNMADMYTQAGSAHIAALTHPSPRRVLVVGLGTGITAGCFTLYPEIREIHVAEIEPAQVDVARIFSMHNYRALDEPRVTIHLDDARHYLVRDDTKYDIIVSEPSNLFVSGMVNLFTREFYELVKTRLNPGGVFLQWVHYYQASPLDFRGLLATCVSVFPGSALWLHQYGDSLFIYRDGGASIEWNEWRRRLAAPPVAADLRRLGLDPPEELLSFFLWGPSDLARYAGNAPLVTDDDPWPEFTTPRVRFSPSEADTMYSTIRAWGPLDPAPIGGENAEIRLILGDMFMEKSCATRAMAEYRRAAELSPGSTGARDRIRRLERLMRGEGTATGRKGDRK